MDELFVKKSLEICQAINNGTTYEYIKHEGNYPLYLLLINTPFFMEKIDWGTSIRGAWWNEQMEIDNIIQEYTGQPLEKIKFTKKQWCEFINTLTKFVESDL